MRSYLFAIALGPVQGFIGAARRTRDFWMGSTLLSECAKAAARWIVEQPPGSAGQPCLERLIFPAPESGVDLTAWDFNDQNTAPTSDFNVTNVLLFQLASGDPAATVAAIRRKVVAQWQWFVEQTLSRGAGGSNPQSVRDDLRVDVLDIQEENPEDVFEFFGAWVPFNSAKDDYSKARQQLMRLFNGRKSIRDFAPLQGVAGVPKSSLDGRRETVLKEPEHRQLPLRIREAEQLDLVGLVKRLQFGNDSIRFPSVSRFAVDPWIRGALQNDQVGVPLLNQLKQQCQTLVKAGLLRVRKSHNPGPLEDDWPKYPWWREFPFEGTPLLVNRHHELTDEKLSNANEATAKAMLAEIVKLLKYDRKQLDLDAPQPYFAIIAADGDRMGQTISTLAKRPNAKDLHRAFSSAQSKFDDELRQRIDGRRDFVTGSTEVTNRLHGATVFAGADDVLAFVPLDQCLAAAWMMQALFRQKLQEKLNAVDPTVVAAMEADGTFPTLSVGIAIGHFLDPLEDLLRFAKQAEERAKNPTGEDKAAGQSTRNGLAIAVHSRGGAPFTMRVNWCDRNRNDQAVQNLNAWVRLSLMGELSDKAAYDLRELARSYALNTWRDRDALAAAISGDAVRVLGRKRGDDGDARNQLRKQLKSVRTPADLEAVANQLLVGQWIAKSQRQSGFRWSPTPAPSPTQAVGAESQPTEEATR